MIVIVLKSDNQTEVFRADQQVEDPAMVDPEEVKKALRWAVETFQ